MVTLLSRSPRNLTFGEQVAAGLQKGADRGSQLAQAKYDAELKQKLKEAEEVKRLAGLEPQNKILQEKYGVDLAGITDPEARKTMLGLALRGETASQKQQKEADLLPKMKSFADQLEENNPDSPAHKMIADIYRSELPSDEKSNLVKTLTGVDPFKVDQQNRLHLDSVLRRYTTRIKEIDNEIKNVKNPSSTGRSELINLKKQRDALSAERDKLLNFKALSGMNEEEDFEEDEEPTKVKFNPKNPEHVRKFQQLDKTFKGNRDKVNTSLAKEFSL